MKYDLATKERAADTQERMSNIYEAVLIMIGGEIDSLIRQNYMYTSAKRDKAKTYIRVIQWVCYLNYSQLIYTVRSIKTIMQIEVNIHQSVV